MDIFDLIEKHFGKLIVLGFLGSAGFIAVVIWAIIRVVLHFT